MIACVESLSIATLGTEPRAVATGIKALPSVIQVALIACELNDYSSPLRYRTASDRDKGSTFSYSGRLDCLRVERLFIATPVQNRER